MWSHNRSPGWMPLDYCLWEEVETRALSKPSQSNESSESYSRRLKLTAQRLPKDLVKKCLLKMKGNIEATLASGGKHTLVE